MTRWTVITHVLHIRSLAVVQYRPTMKLSNYVMEGLRDGEAPFMQYRTFWLSTHCKYVTVARKKHTSELSKIEYRTDW